MKWCQQWNFHFTFFLSVWNSFHPNSVFRGWRPINEIVFINKTKISIYILKYSFRNKYFCLECQAIYDTLELRVKVKIIIWIIGMIGDHWDHFLFFFSCLFRSIKFKCTSLISMEKDIIKSKTKKRLNYFAIDILLSQINQPILNEYFSHQYGSIVNIDISNFFVAIQTLALVFFLILISHFFPVQENKTEH